MLYIYLFIYYYYIRLKEVHEKNYIHHDLYSDNIFSYNVNGSMYNRRFRIIPKLNEKVNSNEIFGVITYLSTWSIYYQAINIQENQIFIVVVLLCGNILQVRNISTILWYNIKEFRNEHHQENMFFWYVYYTYIICELCGVPI